MYALITPTKIKNRIMDPKALLGKYQNVSILTVDGVKNFAVPTASIKDGKLRVRVTSHGERSAVLHIPTTSGEVMVGVHRKDVEFNV